MVRTKRNTNARGRIEFDHLGIGQVLSRYRLIVPVNQREYSWKDEHIKNLLQDFANAIRTHKSSYFLGTVVLTGGDDLPEVADGQQRLATTTLLLAAIRDYFYLRGEERYVNSIENDFLFKFIRETGDISPRLTLNVQDNEFFRKRILSLPDTPDREIEATKSSHRRINSAANLAAQYIEDILRPLNDNHKVSALNEWVHFIEETAQVIVLEVPDDLNAFIMFETLNDRGLKTSQADLVKNHLFGEAGDRIAEAQEKWAAMSGALESLGIDDIAITYLRHLLSSLHGLTRDREVLNTIKEHYAGRAKTIEVLNILASHANDYVAILDPSHSKWNGYRDSIRKHVRTLIILQAEQIRPLLIAVTRNFSIREAEKAFRLFVCWTVRFLISGGRGGTLEKAYSERAKEINNSIIKTTKQLASAMADIVPTDIEFESAFETTTVSKSHLARYYLRALEQKINGNPEPEWIPNEETVINLEHVLPQNPDEKEWGHIEPELAAAYHKRLGNMVLLQASKNSSIGNRGPAIKRTVLKDSTYILTAEVGRKASWGIKEINDRQRKLAKLAVETWPIDVT